MSPCYFQVARRSLTRSARLLGMSVANSRRFLLPDRGLLVSRLPRGKRVILPIGFQTQLPRSIDQEESFQGVSDLPLPLWRRPVCFGNGHLQRGGVAESCREPSVVSHPSSPEGIVRSSSPLSRGSVDDGMASDLLGREAPAVNSKPRGMKPFSGMVAGVPRGRGLSYQPGPFGQVRVIRLGPPVRGYRGLRRLEEGRDDLETGNEKDISKWRA